MAYIFKKKHNSKGVLIFTHKEVFRSKCPEYFEKFILKNKKDYVYGMHCGGFIRDWVCPNYIDFVIGKKSTATFKNENSFYRINMSSKYFVEDFFKYEKTNKKYDLISISTLSPAKNINIMMKCLNDALMIDSSLKIKIIIAHGDKKSLDKFIENLNCNKLLLRYADIDIPNENSKLYRYSRQRIFEELKSSRISIFFSEKEGSCKAVAEPLVCGNRVFIYEKMLGGGLDDLSNKLGVFKFKNFKTAHIDLIKFVNKTRKDSENMSKVISNYYSKIFSKKNTKYIFKNEIIKIFKNIGENYDHYPEDMDNINFKLPAHYKGLPWDILGEERTSDVLTVEQINILQKHI